jgi:prepilin-type N-terminal cleavage/methylation domain-containing protein/prepilin-type processing-associated H-X9-DG protein
MNQRHNQSVSPGTPFSPEARTARPEKRPKPEGRIACSQPSFASGHAGIIERSHAGFTLIELLVVVVVMAILAALLLPALAKAKEKPRSVQCMNNLRQWVLAFSLYKDDNEFIPREGHRRDGQVGVDSWANVRDPANEDVWYNALPPYLNEQPARQYASSLAGARPKFYEQRVFHCPSAQFPAGVGTDNDALFSLGMNSKLIMAPIQNPQCSIRFDSIQRPVDTVAFLEARVKRTEAKVDALQWDLGLGQPSLSASRFAPRHDQGGNLAFCDGHVARHPGIKVVENRPSRNRGFGIFPDGEIIWCADPVIDPAGPD